METKPLITYRYMQTSGRPGALTWGSVCKNGLLVVTYEG